MQVTELCIINIEILRKIISVLNTIKFLRYRWQRNYPSLGKSQIKNL